MGNKKQKWIGLIQWCAAVLLFVAALQQIAMLFMWSGVSQKTLMEALEWEYLPKQSGQLYQQLSLLAEAAGVEPPDAETLDKRISQAAQASLKGENPPQAQAGTEMKAQIQAHLQEKQLEPTEEIAQKMDLLEAEGNRLEQAAMQQPVWEKIKGYIAMAEGKQQLFPRVAWIAGLLILAFLGFWLPKMRLSSLLSGLAVGGMLSSLMMILMKAQVKRPLLQMNGCHEEVILNNALEKYFAPLQYHAAIIDVAFSVASVMLAILLLVVVRKTKRS